MKFNAFVLETSDTEWLIEGLVPANQKGLIVGRPGHGKSWFLEEQVGGGISAQLVAKCSFGLRGGVDE